jgi:hypothetical protein
MTHNSLSTGYTIRNKPYINIIINIESTNINNNIFKFFQTCSLSVFGYNATNNSYYGKKHKNGSIVFHFVLTVICKGNNLTHIEINTLHDDKLLKDSLQFTKKLARFIQQL